MPYRAKDGCKQVPACPTLDYYDEVDLDRNDLVMQNKGYEPACVKGRYITQASRSNKVYPCRITKYANGKPVGRTRTIPGLLLEAPIELRRKHFIY